MATCCEFVAPAVVGDTAAVVTIRSGSGGDVSGIVITAEGCSQVAGDNCAYQDTYDDTYCDVTAGGAYPNASVSDAQYTITSLPANSILTIDAAEQSITLTDETGNPITGDLDPLDWVGLFEWIVAAKSGCQRICVDTSGATVNPDTDVSVTTFDREL